MSQEISQKPGDCAGNPQTLLALMALLHEESRRIKRRLRTFSSEPSQK